MTPPIGFVLITHGKPLMIHRLVKQLNYMFDQPPIVCHHDFSKCALSVESFPKNVSFVKPYLKTGWGEFSVVEAIIRAIQKLYVSPDSPDWFVLLSAADYPIKSANTIINDLNKNEYDAHIYFELIKANKFEWDWQRECYYRYYKKTLAIPFINRKLNLTKRVLEFHPPQLPTWLLPFSEKFSCYAGSLWFSASRKASEYILKFHATNPWLANHYRHLMFTDESYFQCVLANASHLRLNCKDWRYVDWSENGPHPKTLTMSDLPKLMKSSSHFARKFDIQVDSQVLDQLDTLL